MALPTAEASSIVNSGTGLVSSLTVPSFTTMSGPDTILLVFVALRDATRSVSGVTYGGQALTPAGDSGGTNVPRLSVWYKVAPGGGSQDIVVTIGGGTVRCVAAAVNYFHIDRTNPIVEAVFNWATSATPNIAGTLGVYDRPVEFVGNINNDVFTADVATTSMQTARTSNTTANNNVRGTLVYSGASNGAYSHTHGLASSRSWQAVSIELRAQTWDLAGSVASDSDVSASRLTLAHLLAGSIVAEPNILSPRLSLSPGLFGEALGDAQAEASRLILFPLMSGSSEAESILSGILTLSPAMAGNIVADSTIGLPVLFLTPGLYGETFSDSFGEASRISLGHVLAGSAVGESALETARLILSPGLFGSTVGESFAHLDWVGGLILLSGNIVGDSLVSAERLGLAHPMAANVLADSLGFAKLNISPSLAAGSVAESHVIGLLALPGEVTALFIVRAVRLNYKAQLVTVFLVEPLQPFTVGEPSLDFTVRPLTIA